MKYKLFFTRIFFNGTFLYISNAYALIYTISLIHSLYKDQNTSSTYEFNVYRYFKNKLLEIEYIYFRRHCI